ncbi:hypothetical protein ABPG74_018343 [Tetrahymena malaccensis]
MGKNIFLNEKQIRLLQLFLPYTVIVILAYLVMGMMVVFYYQQNVKDQLQDLILSRYNQYLDFMSTSEKMLITFSFQRISSYTQTFGILNNHLLNDDIKLNDIVAWDDKSLERYSLNQNKPNFLLQNQYQLKDYCQPIELCQQNQICINNFNNYLLQQNYFDDNIQYVKAQFASWSSSMHIDWEDLNDEQKEYLIKMNLQQAFWQSYIANQKNNIIQSVRIYTARQSDGLYYQILSENYLLVFSLSKNTYYGGPFACIKVNGRYPEYAFTNADQFQGFLYQDQNLQSCGNSTSPCSCPYFNQKRLLPLDWRCRPWYQEANNSFYVQFSQPYIDFGMKIVASTSTFKIVKSQESITSIQQELNYQQDGVQAMDLNLQNIQIRFLQNFDEEEYSYLVSTNPSKNSTDYIPLVMAHPHMDISTQQNIYDIEFQNSENKDKEEQMYQNQTSFLRNIFSIENSCQEMIQMNNSYIRTIIKDGQQYLTRFSPIFVCYGNLNESYSSKVAYYVKSISYQKRDQSTKEVSSMMDFMVKTIFILVFAAILFISIVFFILLKYFLKYNFEIPIAIVSKVIQEADCESIYILNTKIERGELKTSSELKNLIFTINKVILKFQEKVDKKLQDEEDNFNQIQNKYLKSINTFYAFSHKTGLGMCLNNLSVLYMFQKSYKKAFYFMNIANRISNQIFEENTQPLMNELNLSVFQAIKYILYQPEQEEKINFFKIYSCRKYQFASILYFYLKKSYKKQGKNQQQLDLSHLAQQSQLLLNRQTVFERYQTNYSKTSLQTRESMIFNKFYLDDYEEVNEIKGFDEQYIFCNDEKQALISFSMQLIKEGNDILQIYCQTKAICIKEQDRNRLYMYQVLFLFLSIQFQLLNENNIKFIIIKQLLIQIKKLIFQYYKVQSNDFRRLQTIFQQKYFYYKALLYFKKIKYNKSLNLILKSLNFNYLTSFDSQSKFSFMEKPLFKIYDSYISYKSLKLLSEIIKINSIELQPIQLNQIKQDQEILKLLSSQQQKNELHFFEVFFLNVDQKTSKNQDDQKKQKKLLK